MAEQETQEYKISIHAPPRGATTAEDVLAEIIHFNSRPSARGDASAPDNTQAMFISIHAPPRGATSEGWYVVGIVGFQFTPLREGRRQMSNEQSPI